MQIGWKRIARTIASHVLNVSALGALIGVSSLGHVCGWKLEPLMRTEQNLGAEPGREHADAAAAQGTDAAAAGGAARQDARLPPVTLGSPKAIANSGIEFGRVEMRPMARHVKAFGVVGYDKTRVAQLVSRVDGTVWSVRKLVGQAVRQGEVLAIIEALDVGRSKTEFLRALVDAELKAKTLERMRAAHTAIPERQIREADARAREARIVLFNAQQTLANLGLPVRLDDVSGLHDQELVKKVRFLGVPESIVKSVDPSTTTANLVCLKAPFDGVITDCEMVTGELVSPARHAFIEMADVSRMWIELDVHLDDAAELRRGQKVVFSINGAPGDLFGELSWISTKANPRTRSVLARMEVDNPLANDHDPGRQGQRLLRANMFGEAKILVQSKTETLTIPDAAVQRDGAENVVFVQTSETTFEPRLVELGFSEGGFTEVLDGVSLGEIVAAAGSHALKAEIAQSFSAIGRY